MKKNLNWGIWKRVSTLFKYLEAMFVLHRVKIFWYPLYILYHFIIPNIFLQIMLWVLSCKQHLRSVSQVHWHISLWTTYSVYSKVMCITLIAVIFPLHSFIIYNSLWILSIFCKRGPFLWCPQHGWENTHRALQQLGRSSIFHDSPRLQHQNAIIIQYCGQTMLEHRVLWNFMYTSNICKKQWNWSEV